MGFFKTTGVGKFRIFVDSPPNGQMYRRGDLLKGNVYLSVASAIKYKVISIQLTGDVNAYNTDPPIQERIVDYISYLKTPPHSGDNLDAVGCLTEGEYHFPFAIKLPDNALPSVSAHSIEISYKLFANITREGAVFNNSESQEIFVMAGISREQFGIEAKAPQFLRNATVAMKNSFMKNCGVVECNASVSGTVLVTTKPTERIHVAIDVDASGGKKPVNSAKLELQMVLQMDCYRKGYLTAQYGHNVLRPGDVYTDNAGHVRTWVEPHVKSWYTVVAEATMSPGYVEGQAGTSGAVCGERTHTMWKTDMVGEAVPAGGRGRFAGSVMLDTSDSRNVECIPTVRGEHLQVNWRVAITLDNCSKTIYMPIVVVDTIVENGATDSSGNGSIPWFHHEKYTMALTHGQQYEVPALGTVVRDNTHEHHDQGSYGEADYYA